MVLGILAILSAIGSIIGSVWDTILGFIQGAFSLLQSFIQSAPTPMKVAIFLLFILTLGNIFSSFLVSVRYACDGNNVLYESEDIGTTMILMVKTLVGMDVGDRNSYIQTNFNLVNQRPSPTTIRCVATQPKLYFYSVNIFDYKIWLLLLVLVFGAPMIWNYYSRMGALK